MGFPLSNSTQESLTHIQYEFQLIDINRDPELEDWRYDTLDNGVRLLYEYLNKTNPDLIVPANRTEINVGTWDDSADAPFQNVQQFNSVDLNNVPFKNKKLSLSGEFTA